MQNKLIENTLLLDYYGDLLTKHQVDILNEYYNEDHSMNEIATNIGISKAAVQDLIKRSIKQLQNYEKVLKLIQRDNELNDVLDQMRSEKDKTIDKYIKKIEKINK